MAFNDIVDEQDRARLERVQRLREQIIDEVMADGKVPADKEDRAFLMEAARDLDKSIINKARIKVADKTGEGNANAAKIIADVLARHVNIQQTPRSQPVVLDPSIRLENVIEGELSLDGGDLNYDHFMSN